MDTFIPIATAARLAHLTESNLNQLIQVGILKAAKFSGGILVSQEDLINNLPKQQRPEYDASLAGVPISIGEAARRYNVVHPTISRWVSKGYIKVIEKGRIGQKVLIDEADIKFCATLYNANPGQGNRAFSDTMERITKLEEEG